MKTGFIKSAKYSRATNASGFTLLELLVVLGVIAVLIIVQVPILAGGKSQSKIAMCASHVRQLALACQIYANENGDRLPVLTGSASWPWDVPAATANSMLNSGTTPATFYCPGTAPRFTDAQNWAGPNPSGLTNGANSTLWGFGMSSPPNLQTDFHIVGYSLALSGPASQLGVTNQNKTIQPESIVNRLLGVSYVAPASSDRVLVADATISSGSALPGYAHPENNYTDIVGGYPIHHVSPHLKGNVPAGGNLGFKDGHVDWRKFELMTPRTTSTPAFWW